MDAVGLHLSPHRFEASVELPRFQRSPQRRFDRLAFALKAVDLLRPASTTVVVYRSTSLHVAQGRDLRRGGAARWALVGVPADASAECIALALTEITGVRTVPFVLEAALAAARLPEPEC